MVCKRVLQPVQHLSRDTIKSGKQQKHVRVMAAVLSVSRHVWHVRWSYPYLMLLPNGMQAGRRRQGPRAESLLSCQSPVGQTPQSPHILGFGADVVAAAPLVAFAAVPHHHFRCLPVWGGPQVPRPQIPGSYRPKPETCRQ